MNITQQYLNKHLSESKMDCDVLPKEYQEFLDSQKPKNTTEEDEAWAQLPSF